MAGAAAAGADVDEVPVRTAVPGVRSPSRIAVSLPSLMPGCTGTRIGRSCTSTQTAAPLSPPDFAPRPVACAGRASFDALFGDDRNRNIGLPDGEEAFADPFSEGREPLN